VFVSAASFEDYSTDPRHLSDQRRQVVPIAEALQRLLRDRFPAARLDAFLLASDENSATKKHCGKSSSTKLCLTMSARLNDDFIFLSRPESQFPVAQGTVCCLTSRKQGPDKC
jgi:hypothetical protein